MRFHAWTAASILKTHCVLQASGSGISLQLAPAQDGGSMPQNFSLSEQTGNITPTLVFADLQGRLSALLTVHAAARRVLIHLLHPGSAWRTCQ